MLYLVTGTFRPEKMREFCEKLTDGTIEGFEPDGREIVASMKRAHVIGEQTARWVESCYCATPLAHERETVYDHYFSTLEAEEVTVAPTLSGPSFWAHIGAEL